MKNILYISLFLFLMLFIPYCRAEFIVSGAEGAHADAFSSCEFALNIGPGWYKTDSAIIAPQLMGDPITSIVKTKFKTLAALVGEFTLQPHKHCFTNINIGGGWLRNGKAIFIDTTGTTRLRREFAPFDGDFFNVNAILGTRYMLRYALEIEASLGYSYDHGTLTTAGPNKPNYNIFSYSTAGPVMALGINYQKNKFSLNGTYSFILGAYKETALDKIQNTTLLIRIPTTFTNHIDLVGQYEMRKDSAIGLVLSLDFFKNHGTGTAQPCNPHFASPTSVVPYDTTTTILLLGFAAISF